MSQLLVLFGLFALILVGIYWINRAVRLFDQLVSNGHSALIFLELTTLTLPDLVRFVVPLAGFSAVLWGVNRMHSDSEFVVLQATGISPWRLARPLAVFGIALTAMLFLLTHWLAPASLAELKQRENELRQDVSARFLKDGEFFHPSAGVTVFVSNINSSGMMQDMFLSDQQNPDVHVTYSASRALLTGDDGKALLVMFEGVAQTRDLSTNSLSITTFDDAIIDLSEMASSNTSNRLAVREMTSLGLLDGTHTRQIDTSRARAIIHQRNAEALLAPAVVLLGFAILLLGGFSRFGSWRQIAFAIAAIVVLKGLDNAMINAVGTSAGAWPMLYLAPFSGACAAIVLIWLSTSRRRVGRMGTGRDQNGVAT